MRNIDVANYELEKPSEDANRSSLSENLYREGYSLVPQAVKSDSADKTQSKAIESSDSKNQSVLDLGLGQNLYAQRNPNESDEQFIERRGNAERAIQRGASRGLDESTRNIEQYQDATGRIRVREGGGPWLGNPVARPTDRNAPAGIYPGPGRDVTIVRPNGRLW